MERFVKCLRRQEAERHARLLQGDPLLEGFLRGLRRLRATTAVIIGSVLYKACVALALSLGLSPFDLKLITAALLLIIIVIGGKNRKVKTHA